MNSKENLTSLSRDELESKLKALEFRVTELNDFIENASLPLHRVDANGIVLWANQAELDALGYTRDEYIGQPIAKFHADEHIINDILARLTNNEILLNYEARLVRKDGAIRDVLINSSVYREDDRFIHTRCFTRDITERKLAEDRIRQSEQQLRLITGALPVLIAYVDRYRRYLFVNDSYETWFGRPHTEMVGKCMREVLGEELYDITLPKSELALSGQEVTFEASVPHLDGRRYVKATYVPDRRNDEVQGFIALIHDLTDRKRMEEDLRSAIGSRDEFLSIASHELKTPLTSLKLQLQMTQRSVHPEQNQAPSPQKLAQVLDISNRQLLRLENLVEDLLDVAKIQSGKLTLNYEQVHLAALIREVADRFETQLKESSSPLHLDLDPNIIGLWDRGRVEQIAVNLISNAIKYAPGKPIEICTGIVDETVFLTVIDHGQGIPADKHAAIFERFERANTSHSISGLGLGLFIVKQIVEAHAGTVTVASEIERGTRFTVALPLQPADTRSLDAVVAALASEQTGRTYTR